MRKPFTLQEKTNIQHRTTKKSKNAGLKAYTKEKEEDKFLFLRSFEDKKNILMVSEYFFDILSFYKELDNLKKVEAGYIKRQKELKWLMRSELVDWIIDVHYNMNLVQETLMITIDIIDRFLSARPVSFSKLQLVGVTALFIACKYEEEIVPSVEMLSSLVEGLSEDELKKAEKYVLKVLDYTIFPDTAHTFIRACNKADNYDPTSRNLSKYILELSLLNEELVGIKRSLLACSCYLISREILGYKRNHSLFLRYSGFLEEEIQAVSIRIIDILKKGKVFENVHRKYSLDTYFSVSDVLKNYLGERDEL